jgi:ABC-2 type transport system ATP-binding protein
MPQDLSVHPYMTGREIIEYFAMVHNMPKHAIRERCNELLHLLDLKELEGKRIKFWSEGQKRRISLACALVQSPSLLIL